MLISIDHTRETGDTTSWNTQLCTYFLYTIACNTGNEKVVYETGRNPCLDKARRPVEHKQPLHQKTKQGRPLLVHQIIQSFKAVRMAMQQCEAAMIDTHNTYAS